MFQYAQESKAAEERLRTVFRSLGKASKPHVPNNNNRQTDVRFQGHEAHHLEAGIADRSELVQSHQIDSNTKGSKRVESEMDKSSRDIEYECKTKFPPYESVTDQIPARWQNS